VDTGIDYDSGVPPYRQLAAILRARIESGELSGRLPGERMMAQEWDVAHGTVRKALGLLRSEGLVETNQGWGSRVLSAEERH
jgi:GntR family transcriptional regulator